MCLDDVTRRDPTPDPAKIVVGYKVLYLRDGKLYPTHWAPSGKDDPAEPMPTGKWLRATNRKLRSESRPFQSYPSGFHIYATFADAVKQRDDNRYGIFSSSETRVVVPVLAKEITSRGRQGGSRVFVARKMFVPEYDANATQR